MRELRRTTLCILEATPSTKKRRPKKDTPDEEEPEEPEEPEDPEGEDGVDEPDQEGDGGEDEPDPGPPKPPPPRVKEPSKKDQPMYEHPRKPMTLAKMAKERAINSAQRHERLAELAKALVPSPISIGRQRSPSRRRG